MSGIFCKQHHPDWSHLPPPFQTTTNGVGVILHIKLLQVIFQRYTWLHNANYLPMQGQLFITFLPRSSGCKLEPVPFNDQWNSIVKDPLSEAQSFWVEFLFIISRLGTFDLSPCGYVEWDLNPISGKDLCESSITTAVCSKKYLKQYVVSLMAGCEHARSKWWLVVVHPCTDHLQIREVRKWLLSATETNVCIYRLLYGDAAAAAAVADDDDDDDEEENDN